MYRIGLCDGVSVQHGDITITKFRTQKAARLLAYLALHPGSHSREKLVELFWPELELDAARNGLSSTLLYLRSPLERERGMPEGSLIKATRTTIGLTPGSYTTDIESLPPGFDTERVLPGFYDDWVLEAREALAKTVVPSLEQREPLPATWTAYFGREDSKAQVQALLDSTRLLTIVGTGGVGKTRLALETLQSREARGEPVAWVELSALTDPARIPERIATALGLASASALVPTLRKQRLLICLDNCEHLIEGAARAAESLLRGCANLRILATSREPLGIAGETILRLPCLTETESAELFCERARRAKPGWELLRQERPHLSLLCLRLDGLPLAIELAAAKLRLYPLTELVLQLETRFAALNSNHRLAEPRQQTLYASIDWSYELLSEKERALFCSLCVFHGGWTLEQAALLWGSSEESMQERLDALVDKSLVQAEPLALASLGGGVRYRFLETIREFAKEQLSQRTPEEQLAWQRAHLEVFYNLLLTVPRRYNPEAAPRSEAIRSEEDNFLPALEFCRQDQPARALIFCWHLSTFWDWFAQSTLAREQLKLTLPLPECQTLDADRLIALDELYWACTYTRDWDGAEWALSASTIATEHPYNYRLYLADVLIDQGELERATALLEINREEAYEGGLPYFMSDSLYRLHRVYLVQGNYAHALSLLDESQGYIDEAVRERYAGYCRSVLRAKSLLKGILGELDEARRLAAQLQVPELSQHEIAYNLLLFAQLEFLGGNLRGSAQLYGASVAQCQRKGFDLRGYAYSNREQNLAVLRESLGEAEFAATYDLGYEGDPQEIHAQFIIS